MFLLNVETSTRILIRDALVDHRNVHLLSYNIYAM